MHLRFPTYAGLLVGVALTFTAPTAFAGPMEDAILAEINFARAYPQEYARRLMLQPITDWGRSLQAGGQPDDPEARAEAIEALQRQSPLPPLQPDDKLAAAALEHVEVQGPGGHIGHSGPDGERFYDRLRRHGVQPAIAAENIAYGPPTAADTVRELIIDSGVPSRGHRHNIFHASFEAVGVSCGPHRDYSTMCVMDFGGSSAAGPSPKRHDRPGQSAE
ncbi:MAG: CAP domain-containing protein [Pseudomonadota bacterium]|uniref:CAP domain-containing protein n=1 Tax=unclassified Phenylobacterium TaxID=2640670 RepID=UPI0006F4F48B|nr:MULTISPECIES: CAP domain-containing protein [unclassified Phenylobacterium]KRB46559.1 hypothetical protein ASE02_18945 [Phenylobacterium sp. Root700]MBT9471726.1 CAP domain-containing protein [Phenylobacterium sp.]